MAGLDRPSTSSLLNAQVDVVLAACWSHPRRRFYEVAQATNAPIATKALRRIAELYAIEAEVRGQSPAHRLEARHNRSKPIVDTMRLWFEAQLPLLPGRSTLAEAIRYGLSRWEGLTRFLHDGPIELDTNPVERAIRPVALGRKNHLFAGSDDGASYCPSVYPLITQGISGWRRKTADCGAIACERHLGARPVA